MSSLAFTFSHRLAIRGFILTGLAFLSLVVVIAKPASATASKSEKNKPMRTLGVLIFPGFQTLDACGPIEIWGNLHKRVKVVTVARHKGEIPSNQGPKMIADYGFDDCPPLDLILVPGGIGVLQLIQQKDALVWLRERSATAEVTMSVCNGASVLAAAGLLDGRRATTNKAFWALATSAGPKVNWVHRARWVDDGNMVTSSGVSAGMDMTLHMAARLFGEEQAVYLANEIEYDWHRDASWDPFAELHDPALKK